MKNQMQFHKGHDHIVYTRNEIFDYVCSLTPHFHRSSRRKNKVESTGGEIELSYPLISIGLTYFRLGLQKSITLTYQVIV